MDKKTLKTMYTKDEETGCWIWHGFLGGNGNRPMVRYKDTDSDEKSKMYYAAPLIWHLSNKQAKKPSVVPKGQHLKSTCDNPLCVAPLHRTPQDKQSLIKPHQFTPSTTP